MLMWPIFTWAIFAVVIFVMLYKEYAQHVAIHPAGKLVVAVALQTKNRQRLLAIFGRNTKTSPSARDLQEIADDIWLLQKEPNLDEPVVEQFLQDLKSDLSQGTRVRVPEPVARGHEIYVGQVHVHAAYLHPSYSQHRTMVVAKTGVTKGKLTQLPWNKPESQKLFKGTV